jgi:CrcB protein
MNAILAVAAGGALGAVSRYLVVGQVARLAGATFPFGTLAVNIAGSLILGLLAEYITLRWTPSEEVRVFLIVGVLGGFTTFSAFSLDAVLLLERGELLRAFGYIAATVLLSVGGLYVGIRLCRLALT